VTFTLLVLTSRAFLRPFPDHAEQLVGSIAHTRERSTLIVSSTTADWEGQRGGPFIGGQRTVTANSGPAVLAANFRKLIAVQSEALSAERHPSAEREANNQTGKSDRGQLADGRGRMADFDHQTARCIWQDRPIVCMRQAMDCCGRMRSSALCRRSGARLRGAEVHSIWNLLRILRASRMAPSMQHDLCSVQLNSQKLRWKQACEPRMGCD
jgi:hypothetical protein